MTVRRDDETDSLCAAKEIHDIFLREGTEGKDIRANNFLQECHLMSSLNHRNITKFLGIFFTPTARLPLLVMERLQISLAKHLDDQDNNLTIVEQESILKDVVCGLAYLHGRQPMPVIHRDLTANNVLLNLSPFPIAKISDVGNSCIIESRSDKMMKTLTQCPGAIDYMPPEAVDDMHCYGPSLDIFSFGHLALYTLIQVIIANIIILGMT